MIQTLFDSTDFPVDERFDRWHEMAMRSLAASDITATEIPHQDFRATMQHLDLGAVQIVAMTYPSLRCRRTPRLIRQNDPEYLSLGMILEGKQGIAQGGRESIAGPDDLVLYDTSHPYEAHVTAATPVVARTVVAQFPRALLPTRNFEQLLGVSGRVREREVWSHSSCSDWSGTQTTTSPRTALGWPRSSSIYCPSHSPANSALDANCRPRALRTLLCCAFTPSSNSTSVIRSCPR